MSKPFIDGRKACIDEVIHIESNVEASLANTFEVDARVCLRASEAYLQEVGINIDVPQVSSLFEPVESLLKSIDPGWVFFIDEFWWLLHVDLSVHVPVKVGRFHVKLLNK